MAVVIRLQGLRITAGSEDIRIFFGGLKIPDGGVHIIGGVREEAFIIFASDEDARRAMVRSGGCIKGAPVNLLLSSKSEMQTILEESTKNVELELKGSPRESPGWHEEDVFGGARRADHMQSNRGARQSSNSHDEARQNLRSPSLIPTDVYVFLRGMPFEVTEQDVRDFFHGLLVEDIILKRKKWGQTNGEGMVKFATRLDARDALMRHKQYIGPRYVNVYPSTQGKWLQASGSLAVGVHGNGKFGRGRSPTRSSRSRSPLALPTHSPRSGSPLALPTHSPSRYPQPLTRSRSPLAPPTRSPRYAQVRTRSRSPLAHSPNSSSNQDFCVILKRLHSAVNKRDVKQFFHHARLEDDQILFVLNKEERTKCIFVLFDSLREYSLALTRQNEKMYDRVVHVSPISRKDMMAILESNAEDDERSLEQQASPWDSEKVCVYLRNMPFDVHKVEIMDFFFGYNITEDKVWLLRDNKGAGLGEALVVFRSEEEAMRAQSLNGQRFLGTEVMLKCISMSQMQDFGVELTAAQESILREERSSYSSRKSEGSHYPGDMEVPNIRMPTDGNRAIQVDLHRGRDPYPTGSYATQDGGNGSVHGDFGPPGPAPQFDGPTRVKIVNLPRRIQMEEIYDFCYGYCVIPGSVKCELRRIQGAWKQVANVDFESREEALRAIKELSGRPVGPRKVQLMLKE